MGSNSVKNPSKIRRNGAQERSESDLGSNEVKRHDRGDEFGGPLAPFGRFWAPFWAQLGAKGLTNSSFLAPSRTKISKNEAQNEASKKI